MMTSDPKSSPACRSVRVLHDTCDVRKYPGVDTSEGLARPLIMGASMFAHTLEMPPGLTVAEHPEPEESMVYTVRGRWILTVEGEEHLMLPGSLHWINEGASAGCQVPFGEPALVMAFMRVKAAATPDTFVKSARDMIITVKEKNSSLPIRGRVKIVSTSSGKK